MNVFPKYMVLIWLFIVVATILQPRTNAAAQLLSSADSKTFPKTTIRSVNYDSGYFATPIVIPDDPRATGITNIKLECSALTDQGGTATILLRNSRAAFNEFGDAEVVNERQTRRFQVTLTRIPATDFNNEARRAYRVVFENDRWRNRFYYVWSPGTITSSRLLIRPRQGKLTEIKLSRERNSDHDPVEMAHVLPDVNQRPDHGRPGSEDLRDYSSLKSTYFQHDPTGERERSFQAHITIYRRVDGKLKLTFDSNRTSFNLFGDAVIASAAGMGFREFWVLARPTKDPAGLGRRLFELEFQPGDPRVDHIATTRRPPVDYALVLSAKIDGPHRLIIRRQGEVQHVLPLHNESWKRFQRLRVEVAKLPSEQQQAFDELRRLFGSRLHPGVVDGEISHVTLYSPKDLAAAVSQLSRLPDLKDFSISGGYDLSGKQLEPVEQLQQITSLSFSFTPISDTALLHISKLSNLRRLQIQISRGQGIPHVENTFTDKGLKLLARLTKLENLLIDEGGVTDAGLEHLKGLTKLKRLRLSKMPLSIAALYDLSESIPDAEIYASAKVLAEGGRLVTLRILRNRGIITSYSQIDDALLEQMEGLQGVKEFGFESCSKITDNGLKSIAKHADLEGLTLQHARQITNDGLKSIGQLKHLKRISFWSCSGITDEGLEHLHQLKELKSLSLSGAKVTAQGIERIHQALPECKIEKRQ